MILQGFEGHGAMTYVSGSPLKRLKEFCANVGEDPLTSEQAVQNFVRCPRAIQGQCLARAFKKGGGLRQIHQASSISGSGTTKQLPHVGTFRNISFINVFIP